MLNTTFNESGSVVKFMVTTNDVRSSLALLLVELVLLLMVTFDFRGIRMQVSVLQFVVFSHVSRVVINSVADALAN